MAETTTSSPAGASSRPGGDTPRPRRYRSLLFAALGVVLAGILAAVVLSSTSGSSASNGGGLVGSPAASMPGISPATVQLLSLSRYPASSQLAPDFTLTDQRGRPLSLSEFRGRAVVLSFNDDRCTDVCTLLAEDVVRADQDMTPADRARVAFVSVNVNPFFPDVASVRSWSDSNGLGAVSNWHFGTGPVATLQAIWKAYGVYVGTDPATHTVTHSTVIEMIDPSGHMRASADFGQNAVDVAPYSHGLAQAAVDLLPSSQRDRVSGPQASPGVGSGGGVGQMAPGFHLPVLGSPASTFDLAAGRGRPVVINFWASTCQGCRAELAAFARAASADPKVQFLGVDVADPATTTALRLARDAGITYPLLEDRGGQVASAYGVSGLPTTVYVDPSGHVAVVHPGAMTAEQLRYTLAQFFPGFTPGGS